MKFFEYLWGAIITIVFHAINFCIEKPAIGKLALFGLIVWFLVDTWIDMF